MKRISILFLLAFVGQLSFTACTPKLSNVDKRKKQLSKKKRRDPNDCPKLDCD